MRVGYDVEAAHYLGQLLLNSAKFIAANNAAGRSPAGQ